MKIRCAECTELVAEVKGADEIELQVSTEHVASGAFGTEAPPAPFTSEPELEYGAGSPKKRWWVTVPLKGTLAPHCRRDGDRTVAAAKLLADFAEGRNTVSV